MYRSEHPKPQFERKDWLNLNGEWAFCIDHGNSGVEREFFKSGSTFDRVINLPFCPESELSNINYKDFMHSVWYKRKITLPSEWRNDKVFIHFGAVDYKATVYVNGLRVGEHKGGYSSFKFDITDYIELGENEITVHAEDDTRDIFIPSGKQSQIYQSYGGWYTRVTGIYQTVWLERVPTEYIDSVKYYPNVEDCSLTITARLVGSGTFSAKALIDGEVVGCAKSKNASNVLNLTLKLNKKLLWQVGKGGLYDLELEFGGDKVKSYFGLREIKIDKRKVLINESPVFQRLVLDQGYYPNGVYTAPSEECFINDIKKAMELGFNGARLHQRVFEERYLYHADKLGFIVWGEYANWGLNISYPQSILNILPEWIEVLERDFNHPSIVGWSPFNETWWFASGSGEESELRRQCNQVIRTVYLSTKAIDCTRPCLDTSGGVHIDLTDITDTHNYSASAEEISNIFKDLKERDEFFDSHENKNIKANKKPVFLSEYGGIKWSKDANSWGYGDSPKTEKEFLDRLFSITNAVLENGEVFGFCYTQLYDVENEQNGLLTFDREDKFSPEIINKIISAPSKHEE